MRPTVDSGNMVSEQSRRRFLATTSLGGLAGLTGCAGTDGSAPATERSTASATPTSTLDLPPVSELTRRSDDDREYRGESLHHPDDWRGWTARDGRSSTSDETAFIGRTSLVLTDENGSRIRCAYTPPEGSLDLRNTGLCAAIRWEAPKEVVTLRLLVTDGDGNRLWASANTVPSQPYADVDWAMTEFGISELVDDAFVDLSDVTELQLVFPNGIEADTRVLVDNVRLVPYEPRRGAVLFTADDGLSRQYTVMNRTLDEYDFPAIYFVMSKGTNKEDRLDVDQLLKLAGEGSTLVSPHPQWDRPLPEMSDEESLQRLEEEYEFIADELGLGHEHARFMSWPYGKSDAGTIEQAREFQDLCFDGVRASTTGWSTAAPMSVARASFKNLDDLFLALDIAEHYGRVLIPQFHELRADLETGGVNITPEDFERFVAEVASRDVDVIGGAEFVERYGT
jgi:hypothetical protein